jgi:hypothetical protein
VNRSIEEKEIWRKVDLPMEKPVSGIKERKIVRRI